jgi:DNA-binding transcriptional LysR family regulator
MDSDALDTFLIVYREGGFSSAARQLSRTQPAISRRIALLEQELGLPLFERAAGRTVLSQAGRVLLPYAERALAAVQDAETAVSALATRAVGPVSLALVGTLASTTFGRALKAFAASHREVDLSLRTASSAEVGDLVRRGEADIGLRYERDPSPDLEWELLATEPLVVVCANDHPLANGSVATLAELKSERWLAFPEVPGRGEISAAHVFALFLAHGLGEVRWTGVDSLTAQKRLVESAFGLALVPESSVAEEIASGHISTIRVGDLRAAQPIIALTRKGGFLSTASRRLLQLLRSTFDPSPRAAS